MNWKLLLVGLVTISCSSRTNKVDTDKWKLEIRQTEKAFNDLAMAKGLPIAFETYAAPEAVIKRRGNLVKGQSSIREWYDGDYRHGDTLVWKPEFIDVSTSGDLGYTYGPFTFTYLDTLGNVKKSTGYFHTVWKRQPDGSWKFVWD